MWGNYLNNINHNCSDCMKIIKNNNSSITLKCNHKFHYDCYFTNLLLDINNNIDLLKENIKSCPKCKKEQKISFFENYNSQGKIKKDNEDCPICLQKLGYVCNIVKTQCNHKYHINCLSQWVKKKMDCPMCRIQLSIETIEKLDLLPGIPQQLRRQNHLIVRINPDNIINNESDSDEETDDSSSEELERKEDDEINEYLNDTFNINNSLLNSITINIPSLIPNNENDIIDEIKEDSEDDIFNINDDVISNILINN